MKLLLKRRYLIFNSLILSDLQKLIEEIKYKGKALYNHSFLEKNTNRVGFFLHQNMLHEINISEINLFDQYCIVSVVDHTG